MKFNSKENFALFFGLGLVSACLGYLTGASATPVVGVIIPAIFGLVTLGFATLAQKDTKFKISSLLEKTNVSESNTLLVEDLLKTVEDSKSTRLFLGVAMSIFAILYTSGTVIGSISRNHAWFAPRPSLDPKSLPWEATASEKPATLSDAISWIELQERLKVLGYTQEQLDVLYVLYLEDVKNPENVRNIFEAPLVPNLENFPSLTDLGVESLQEQATSSPTFSQQGNLLPNHKPNE